MISHNIVSQVSRTSVSRLSVNSSNVSRQASVSPDNNGDKKHSLRDQSIEEIDTGENNNLHNDPVASNGVTNKENIV